MKEKKSNKEPNPRKVVRFLFFLDLLRIEGQITPYQIVLSRA